MLKSLPILALAAFSLVACKAMGPNFVAPHEPVPDSYAGDPNGSTSAATAPAPAPAVDSFWWRQFHDPELDRLEERAAADNLDLKAAFLRIVEARIQAQSARAQGVPSVDGAASFTREQLGVAGIVKSQGLANSASQTTQGLIGALERPVNIYQLGFDASWELDLFGKVRRSVESADAQSAGAVESRNDLLVSLQAEVAQTYFQLRAGQTLRAITLELISAQREVFELTQNKQLHGLGGEADVESARAQLSSLQAQLPPFDQTIATARHALAVLTGQTPESLDAEFGSAGVLPPIPARIPSGLPSTLAHRRPDIRNAETALHAATAQIGVAVAAQFPAISLTGTYGLRNLGTKYLFDTQSKFYTFGPKLSVPLFHGGALVANVRLARAQAAEAGLNYRKTVLTALEEVEDGLSDLTADALRTASLNDTVNADRRALDVELDSFRNGLITYISVLTVQIQTIQARQQQAQAVLTESTDLVKLYKALGGGWENAPPVTGTTLRPQSAGVDGR